MSRSLTIIDAYYKNWVKELSHRYRRSQTKAAVKVNNEVLKILTTQIFSNLLKICSRFLGTTIFS